MAPSSLHAYSAGYARETKKRTYVPSCGGKGLMLGGRKKSSHDPNVRGCRMFEKSFRRC
jgi:hypothetical protein